MIAEDDFPTVGITGFDAWMNVLYVTMIVAGFLEVTEYGTLDRGYWRQYYNEGYTPEDAFEEDLTNYGD